ncbi:hypothetical protein C8R43DRAFT_959544 [Mycena crocata]|nr:hypothetical protein C8R43DRAFT_959544 [Mycena crocata]
MSTQPQIVPTNLSAEQLIMDCRGTRDSRYYCLPPFYVDPHSALARKSSGYHYHLVFQGHKVGVFDNWGEAKTSVAGYPDAGHRGYDTPEQCIDAWQKMCTWGVHPHPVDPATVVSTPSKSAARFVNTAPRKGANSSPTKSVAFRTGVKQEQGETAGNTQVLADLKRYCSPILPPPPSPHAHQHRAASPVKSEGGPLINFAIRGGGIVSSSSERTEQRYLDMQRRGEQPDLLITRNFQQASLFAVDDEDEEGTAARKRAREGKDPVKPGKVGWVHGTKLPLFTGYKGEFLASAETKQTGEFYTKMAHLYISIYGWHTDWDDDLAPGQTVAVDVDPNEDVDSLLPEVAAWRAEYFKKLRGFFDQKLGVWYNAEFGGSVSKKQKPITFKKIFNAPAMEPPAPVKPRVLHYYSRRFYNERVSGRVAARWATVARQPNHPAIIRVRHDVTRECWESETEAFRQDVIGALEAEHKAALEAYSIALASDSPKTAQEFDVALNNAGYYLQPFADAVYDHFGMNASIMLCGPVPDRGGRIEVRSVHSGTSNGMVPRVWSDFDRGGFDLAQRSFVDFSHHCFTEEQCRARSLNEMPMAEENGSHVLPMRRDEDALPRPEDSECQGTPPAPPSLSLDYLNIDLDLDLLRPLREEDGAPTPTPPPQQEQRAPTPTFDHEGSAGTALKIAAALRAEIAEMPAEERSEYMQRLRGMDMTTLELENNLARNRLVIRRVDEGMSPEDALLLEAAEDEEGDDGKRKETEEAETGPVEPVTGQTQSAAGGDAASEPSTSPRAATPPAPIPPRRVQPKPMWKGAPGANPAAGSSGVPGEPREGGDVQRGQKEGDTWDGEDRSGWQEELCMAWGAFERGKEWGGDEWEECVKQLIALERAWGFPGKGLLSAPGGKKSPEEVPAWMRAHRKWEKPVTLTSIIGPRDVEESYAARWWSWWRELQPEARKAGDGDDWVEPADVKEEDWDDVAKTHGRNGILLYIGGLLWWGEAAAAGEDEDEEEAAALLDEWREAVVDVSAVLVEVVKRVGTVRQTVGANVAATKPAAKKAPAKKAVSNGAPKTRAKTASAPSLPAAAKTRSSKRQAAASADEIDKENTRPKKRTRSSR